VDGAGRPVLHLREHDEGVFCIGLIEGRMT
jgi:hypothetical protein